MSNLSVRQAREGETDYHTLDRYTIAHGVGGLALGLARASLPTIMPHIVTNRSFARNLRVNLLGDLSTDTLKVTVLVDGAPTAIVISGITGNVPHNYSNTVDTLLVNPGNLISFEIERTGAAGTATNISVSLEVG